MDFLRTHDHRVPQVDKGGQTYDRPLVGIVLEIEGNKFYAPLSSPKPKHRTMKNNKDFIKIDGGKYGVINLNNMVPVQDGYAAKLNIVSYPRANKQDLDYLNLLTNQLSWCNSNKSNILKKSKELFDSIKNGKASENLRLRCCDFILLIEKSKEYKQ